MIRGNNTCLVIPYIRCFWFARGYKEKKIFFIFCLFREELFCERGRVRKAGESQEEQEDETMAPGKDKRDDDDGKVLIVPFQRIL